MRKLGVSIYPDRSSLEENKKYLDLASKYNFTRVFTNLLSVDMNESHSFNDFKEIVKHASNLGMEVIADVSPAVFKTLDIHYTELKFFKDIGLSGIRLDLGFSGKEESIMSFNPYNLKIEVNMSSGTKYIENIMSHIPNKDNIIGCHNFYPHKYTGLSRKHFMETSSIFKKYGLRTAAFVSSSNGNFGPWPVNEGLPTLEEHRMLPIEVQAKDLFNTELIDDVIVSNCYASDEELKSLEEIDKDILTFKVKLIDGLPKIERKIILEEPHFNRGDVSEYMIRSTESRVKYKDYDFQLINPKDIEKGDILIDSSLYTHYSGELQIALKPMKNSGRTSVVGKIVDKEMYLLDYIKPWQKFKFSL
ncbi:DUF871 domain-containing protein [Anaerosalibacter massiliensis]|uniref:MupG family TIM beta-alpha barrel fold protein n=1 Tax=Anaerosalibacter massiliensis TaxID=1347392 RepID=A0A9X2S464_9FIRM|nr:MupG family TIM beta-alpha barrel fold protein [Anaerosalibacter massiliensis]MCR2043410.1 MupG family TIM beta-alpha barrel fold protein [Anaerosalibacter massiliensis]